nr:hypothetical protein [Orientia tsutsugamushi]
MYNGVHSIDRNTWLTKLERIKLLSSKNQDIKFNNLGHIIDLKMLEEQYKELDSQESYRNRWYNQRGLW